MDEKTIRVSFRSNEYCPVNEVAAFFGGGGHPRAAGCTIEETIDQAEEMVLQKGEGICLNLLVLSIYISQQAILPIRLLLKCGKYYPAKRQAILVPLDPAAMGVLPVCLGKATKIIPYP